LVGPIAFGPVVKPDIMVGAYDEANYSPHSQYTKEKGRG
jgi:hypothetical protein